MKPNPPTDRNERKRKRTPAGTGKRVLRGTDDSVEFILDCLAARMQRSSIHRAYALAVEARAAQMAAYRANPGDPNNPMPVILRPLKRAALDELIARAKKLMAASLLPAKVEEARAAIQAYLQRTQRRMGAPGKDGRFTPQQANAGTYAALAEARLLRLFHDPVGGPPGVGGSGTITADDIARALRRHDQASGEEGAGEDRPPE